MRRVRVTPAGVIGSLALFVAMSGTAVAATGGSFLLGKANYATTTTSLTNSKGTALALHSKSGTPPFLVAGNTKQVPYLNSSLLGGFNAAALQAHSSVYGTPGLHVVTVPAGFHHMLVTGVGGGGGGGGGSTTGGSGAGGGEGSHATVWMPVTPGQQYDVRVGAGGAGGAEDNNGSNGTETAVYAHGGAFPNFFLFAGGGSGGVQGNACGASSSGGGAGEVLPPSGTAAGKGALTFDHHFGSPGTDSFWFTFGGCPGSPVAGDGGGHGFVGGGGDGGDSPGAGFAGSTGLAIVQFLA